MPLHLLTTTRGHLFKDSVHNPAQFSAAHAMGLVRCPRPSLSSPFQSFVHAVINIFQARILVVRNEGSFAHLHITHFDRRTKDSRPAPFPRWSGDELFTARRDELRLSICRVRHSSPGATSCAFLSSIRLCRYNERFWCELHQPPDSPRSFIKRCKSRNSASA